MRIEGVDASKADGPLAELFAEQTTRYGRPLPSSRIMARRPAILLGLAALGEGVETSGLLPAALRALVNRRVAAHNGCPF